ncbi:LacI family DNA-binding transcriptional regulator [Jonesiaceae bacterium BS-20]|uniref:LacI family DNA-binding transcriptional regulator n=1 Tax=Jonesiaceae bacterium BS-20 TaxID=3120821 RepID=A0AAU7DVX9_9MICO
MTRVRLKDVAEHAGVSLKTVSNVVNSHPHVKPEMRQKVLTSIDLLGYRPNITARRLATGRTKTLALAVSGISIPYFAELSERIYKQAAARGYNVLLAQTGDTLEGELAVLNNQETGLYDGLIFHPGQVTADEIEKRASVFPCVIIGESNAPPTVDHVFIDNYQAAKDVTEHLLAQGRKNLLFVGYESQHITMTSMQRLMGFRQAFLDRGLTSDPNREIAIAHSRPDSAFEALLATLETGIPVDGIICRDDLPAMGVLRALASKGLRVPQDVAVTGWDNLSTSAFLVPSLTSVDPNSDEIAAQAVDQLIARIEGDQSPGRPIVIPHKIINRESSAGE